MTFVDYLAVGLSRTIRLAWIRHVAPRSQRAAALAAPRLAELEVPMTYVVRGRQFQASRRVKGAGVVLATERQNDGTLDVVLGWGPLASWAVRRNFWFDWAPEGGGEPRVPVICAAPGDQPLIQEVADSWFSIRLLAPVGLRPALQRGDRVDYSIDTTEDGDVGVAVRLDPI